MNFLAKEPAVECGAAASNLSLCPLFPTRLSFDMADNEPYGEPAEGERVERRRRERVKKPPVPVLPDGTWVQIGDSCRSSTLQGQVGTVVAWGRQVEVLLRRPDGSEGDVRKINPTDLVALSEEPGFTAAEEQVTGEEAVPTRTTSRAPTRGVRSTPLGKPAGAVTDEARTASSTERAAAGGGRGRRPARQKKEVAPLELGCWVRVADTCRSATLRGQYGVVLAVGRHADAHAHAHAHAQSTCACPTRTSSDAAWCVRRAGRSRCACRARGRTRRTICSAPIASSTPTIWSTRAR